MVYEDVFNLLNYGVLGAWTIYNLWTIKIQDDRFNELTKKLTQVIENNTIVLTQVKEKL